VDGWQVFLFKRELVLANVAVVTDSVASIPEAILRSLNIYWVPYYIHHGNEIMRDLVSIQRYEFYKWLPSLKELPKTASPGPGDYLSLYEQIAGQGVDDFISIHMTSKARGAYQAALSAKSMLLETFPKLRIEIIDTLNVAMCQGWMAIEAARAALRGNSLTEIAQRVQKMIPITRMVQTADTLKYLYMGGRIGKAKHLIASLLDIKPLIGMEDGEIVALGQVRSRKKAYQAMLNLVEAAVGVMGKVKIAFVHAAAREEADRLKEMTESRLTCVESLVAELSPALGVHSGPGTAGVSFFPVLGED